jgi:hypothetical protein
MLSQNPLEIKQSLLKIYFAMSAFYGTLLNGRIARGYRIVTAGLVSRLDENTYQVISSDGKTIYIVTFNKVIHDNPGWQCTCPDCQAGGHAPVIEFGGGMQATCKHIVAVMMSWAARITLPQAMCDCPDAPPAQAQPVANGRQYNRSTTCQTCNCDWQECDCPTGSLPEPARITTPKNINTPLTVAEQKAAARQSLGIEQEGRRRTSAQFTNIQRWS